MTVELLYFEGCPNHESLLPHLRALIEELAPSAELVLRRMDTPEEAEREHFLGSPTVRVDGLDVEPGAADRRGYGLQCRLYRVGESTSPLPPDAWIENALGAAHR